MGDPVPPLLPPVGPDGNLCGLWHRLLWVWAGPNVLPFSINNDQQCQTTDLNQIRFYKHHPFIIHQETQDSEGVCSLYVSSLTP